MKKGLWIVITGLDGTGKTTLKKDLTWYFRGRELTTKDFKLPYDTHLLSLLDVIGGGLPYKDNYTDRMLFALDNRLVGTAYVPMWQKNYDILISQRGYFDSFVHGAVQGFSYESVEEINKTKDLAKCDVMIHLNADPEVAFNRIKDDPDADKFETLEYIRKQSYETKRGYEELLKGNKSLKSFETAENIFIDTTYLSTDETYEIALKELINRGIID